MKISINWLKEYAEINLPIDKLVKKIGSQLGEVEEVIDLNKKYEDVVIARIVSREKHPNADKLNICKIDDNKKIKTVARDNKGYVQVVAGAPNVAENMLVAWLPPSSTVPATFEKDQFVLEARELRGEVSNGMLASPKELDISDDHKGVLELDQGVPGDSFAKVYGLNDYVIDIENKMFTHRPDCFGILGVAREVAGISQKQFVSPEWYLEDDHKTKSTDKLDLNVVNELPDLVPRFMAVCMSGVQVGSSPLELQIKIKKIGIKPINNIVDITNYIMHVTAQPMHAYDYDKVKKLSGAKPTIVIRKPKPNEKIKVLGGKMISPQKDAIMIATDKQAIGIGGVIGGIDTEVDGNTTNIILECANFDLYSIRRTSMTHGLFTDAATRFSKGQSALQNDKVLAYCVDLITKMSGAKVASKTLDSKKKLPYPEPVLVERDFVNARLGLDLSTEQIVKMLRRVEFAAEMTRMSVLLVKPPFWRTDIEIAEDVVEEIGRLYGYDNLPLELPRVSTSAAVIDPELKIKHTIRDRLSSLGANELLSYSFINSELLTKVKQDPKIAFTIKNALSPDLENYRLSIAPSLLEKVHSNIKTGNNEFALFELGKAHRKTDFDGDLPKEFSYLGLVYTNNSDQDEAAYYQAKNYLLNTLSIFGIEDVEVSFEPLVPTDKIGIFTYYHQERSAKIIIDGKDVGFIGEYNNEIATALKLPVNCSGFELDLDILSSVSKPLNYRLISKLPDTVQDVTLKSSYDLSFAKITKELVNSLEKNKPEDVVYKIKPTDVFAKDKKSKNTTFRLSFNSPKRTLTTKVVNLLLDKTVEDLARLANITRE